MSSTPCSGLGSFSPCTRRDQCANHSHWTLDPRSAFSLCYDGKFQKYIGKDVAAPARSGPQLGLFDTSEAA